MRRGPPHGWWAGTPSRTHTRLLPLPSLPHLSSLRPLDIEFLRRLCQTVNVVPVIARADSLTIEERETFRRRIQHNLKTHCIDVYPQQCFDEDVNDRILNSKIRVGGRGGQGGWQYQGWLVVFPPFFSI